MAISDSDSDSVADSVYLPSMAINKIRARRNLISCELVSHSLPVTLRATFRSCYLIFYLLTPEREWERGREGSLIQLAARLVVSSFCLPLVGGFVLPTICLIMPQPQN